LGRSAYLLQLALHGKEPCQGLLPPGIVLLQRGRCLITNRACIGISSSALIPVVKHGRLVAVG